MKKVDVYEIIIKTFGLIFLYEGVSSLEYLITNIISIYQLQSAKGDAAFSSFIAIGTTSITVLSYFLIYGGLFYFFFFKTSKLIKLVAKGVNSKFNPHLCISYQRKNISRSIRFYFCHIQTINTNNQCCKNIYRLYLSNWS